MNYDSKVRLGATVCALRTMGYNPVGYSGYCDFMSTIDSLTFPTACVSINYLFSNALEDKLIVEVTKDGYCAIRPPYIGEIE